MKTKQNNERFVSKVFEDVFDKYDLMNDLMSLGVHRLWKKEFISWLNPQKNTKLVDVASGTGDIAKLFMHETNYKGQAYCVDENTGMLNLSKKKFKKKYNVKWFCQNAENLPFKNNSFDKYVISFCLRNITFMETALDEALRVLKPNGIFYCLEFSSPKLKSLSKFYDFYKSKIIPKIGKYIAKNEDAYNYLDQSISMFPNQELLKAILIKKGFNNVSNINFFNGIVSLHIGYKTI